MKRWHIHAPSSWDYEESPEGEWVEWSEQGRCPDCSGPEGVTP